MQTHTDNEIIALGGLMPTELQATLKRVQTISLTPYQHSNITVSVQNDELVRQLSKLVQLFSVVSQSVLMMIVKIPTRTSTVLRTLMVTQTLSLRF